jgi:uncharacterized DUF497 family protein
MHALCQGLTLYTTVIYTSPVAEDDGAIEFDWDEGNAEKNWLRHRVSRTEAEQVFFNQPLVVAEDELHSLGEVRFYALGRCDAGRLLFVAYTVRSDTLRIISVRDMTKRERKEYEHVRTQELEGDPEV